MSVMDHDQPPRSGGMGKFLVIGAAAIAVLVAAYFGVTVLLTPEEKPEPAPAARTEPAPTPAARPAAPETPVGEPAPRRPRPRKEAPAAAEPAAPPQPTGPTLIIESDVPGASVFVDRKFIGMTPLRTTEVAGGSHQLNASVTGEEGLAQTIDIAEAGETTITLKFREVRLNASVAVVHKHSMGRSCEGRLVATPEGVRYDSANKNDAFAFPFSALEVFEIDYLKKELKVKQKGGKNWNFTDKSENADKLFVFHRDVTKARDKMAAQAK